LVVVDGGKAGKIHEDIWPAARPEPFGANVETVQTGDRFGAYSSGLKKGFEKIQSRS
jgi:hypothetical protein